MTSDSGETARVRQRVTAGVILVLALSILVRLPILFTSESHLRSDEACVGLMAKHIVTRGESPVFLYGQFYGGGHAIVAYIAALPFHIWGRSATLLTAITMSFSVGAVLVFYLICQRYFGNKVAITAALLYAIAPPALSASFLVNGNMVTMFLSLIGLWLFMELYLRRKGEIPRAFALGAVTGLAYYGMDFALLYRLTYIALCLAADRKLLFSRKGVAMGFGFILGAMPLIIYNATHDFAHLKYMFSRGNVAALDSLHAFRDMWLSDLPAFFSWYIDDYGQVVSWASWLLYGVFLCSLVALLYDHRRDIRRLLSFRSQSTGISPAVFPLAFVAVFVVTYCLSPFSLAALRTPRYFMPLYPFVALMTALVALRLFAQGPFGRIPAALLIGIVVCCSLAEDWNSVLLRWHKEQRIKTSGQTVAQAVEFLKKRNIRYVIAPYEYQWRLMFESDEEIIATCHGVGPLPQVSPVDRYPLYTDEVRNAAQAGAPLAFVFRDDFAFAEWAFQRGFGGANRERLEDYLRRAQPHAQSEPINMEARIYYPIFLTTRRIER